MNQLVEKFQNFSLARSQCEDVGNFILCIISKYGEDAKKATPYAILGCLCVWIYVRSKRMADTSRPRFPSHVFARSLTMAKLYGGELAWQRLGEVLHSKDQVNPATLDNTESHFKDLLGEEHLDLKNLQSTVAKLEMSGREGTAVDILTQAKEANAGKPHHAYEIEMLLVEMLIYKGDFEDALKCECLKDGQIADARRPLYKAILIKMLGNSKEAKECWEEFTDIRRQFIEVKSPPLHNGVYQFIDFDQFEKIVDDLKSVIDVAGRK